MSIIRTPEERFAKLPEFPFAPHYVPLEDETYGTLRMHYLDEGPADGPILVMLHGQGSWCYIFRRMIPILTTAGFRVICPDFIGFGRSDKLPSTEDYTFNRHVGWMVDFFRKLDLRQVDCYMFDWGGFFGLRIAGEDSDQFRRIALSNTQLPVGDSPGRDWFIRWRTEQFALPAFPQGEMVEDGTHHRMTPETIAAFDAPYPDESYKTGPRRFPMILPISADMGGVPENQLAWERLGTWANPVLTLFSADFKGTAMGPDKLLSHIPGCANQPHHLFDGAGFYIVEDKPVELAHALIDFCND